MNPSDLELYELIDLYLEGELSIDDRKAFETRLENDPDLKLEFEKQQELFLALNEHTAISGIKQEVEQVISKTTLESSAKNDSLNYSFKQLIITSGAIAACISFLFLGSFYLIFNKKTDTIKEDKYLQISEKLSTVSNKQTDLWLRLTSAISKEIPQPTQLGTCIYLTDSVFLTSKHILKNKENIKINNWVCEFINEDSLHDLALVKVKDSSFISPNEIVVIGPNKVSLAQEIFSLGHPKKDIVYKSGVISSNTGFRSDTLQYEISTELNPGNSGGPIFNTYGELIGVSAGKSTLHKGSAFVVKTEFINSYLLKNSIKLSGRNKIRYAKRVSQVEFLKQGVFRISANELE